MRRLLQSAQLQAPLRVAYTAVGGGHSALWVTHEAGFFQKHGVEILLLFIQPSSLASQALIGGSIDVAQGAAPTVAQANARGANLAIIGSGYSALPFSLMARPEIQNITGLRGKMVGITRAGALTDFGMRLLLRRSGLEPERDVKLLQLGGLPEILSALSIGQVQAGLLDPPVNLRAKALGFRELMTPQEIHIPISSYCFFSSKAFIARHRNALRKFYPPTKRAYLSL